MYKTALFDLDGTLTDPGIGITNSVMYALKKYGITVNKRSELYSFIGPPLAESFCKYCGFSQDEGMRAVDYYREYYRDKGIFENRIYDGVPEMLELLRQNGVQLAVATSKPEIFAKQILEHFSIDGYFYDVTGSMLDGGRVDKAEVIACSMGRCGIADKSTVIMTGDRSHDVIGAKKNGIASLGVLFGYGSADELSNAGADALADSPSHVAEIILCGEQSFVK